MSSGVRAARRASLDSQLLFVPAPPALNQSDLGIEIPEPRMDPLESSVNGITPDSPQFSASGWSLMDVPMSPLAESKVKAKKMIDESYDRFVRQMEEDLNEALAPSVKSSVTEPQTVDQSVSLKFKIEQERLLRAEQRFEALVARIRNETRVSGHQKLNRSASQQFPRTTRPRSASPQMKQRRSTSPQCAQPWNPALPQPQSARRHTGRRPSTAKKLLGFDEDDLTISMQDLFEEDDDEQSKQSYSI